MPESAIIISYFDLYMVSYSPNITVVNTDEYHVKLVVSFLSCRKSAISTY
jgi:hypothetical protein